MYAEVVKCKMPSFCCVESCHLYSAGILLAVCENVVKHFNISQTDTNVPAK